MSLSAIAAALGQFCVWTGRTTLHASVLIALVLVIQFAFGKRLPVRLLYAFSLLVLLRLILLALFLPQLASAQKEKNIWYFGNGAGIDFNSGGSIRSSLTLKRQSSPKS